MVPGTEYGDETDQRTVAEQIALANRIVAGWPKWKQNILEESASPTVPVARKPVCNFRDEY